MKLFDHRGIRFRLYLLFLSYALGIVGIVFFIQLFNIQNRYREETLNSLKRVTWNISATYGSDAYYKAMRAAAYSGEYLIKTITEDGTELDTVGIAGLNVEWPKIMIGTDELIDKLNNSNGQIDYSIWDNGEEWVVNVQVLASWEGKREIIFVAQSARNEKERIQAVMIQLTESFLIILSISSFMAWVLAKQFLRPIEIITENVKLLSKGEYSIKFQKNTYTEINLLSEMLERAANEFASYEQIRRDLIANLSHEMRTPLTIIKAYAEMVLNISGDYEEKREEHLKIIISQSNKLSEFVNASLQLAQLQSIESRLRYEKFSLERLVAEIIGHFEVIYPNVSIKQDLQTKTFIKADRGMIEQVVFNLINNAIRYTNEKICVNVKMIHKDICFEVIDDGVGIAKENLPFIWTKYYKVNPYSKDSASTGVGLSIVKEILEMHRFEYGVESELTNGSKFWFKVAK